MVLCGNKQLLRFDKLVLSTNVKDVRTSNWIVFPQLRLQKVQNTLNLNEFERAKPGQKMTEGTSNVSWSFCFAGSFLNRNRRLPMANLDPFDPLKVSWDSTQKPFFWGGTEEDSQIVTAEKDWVWIVKASGICMTNLKYSTNSQKGWLRSLQQHIKQKVREKRFLGGVGVLGGITLESTHWYCMHCMHKNDIWIHHLTCHLHVNGFDFHLFSGDKDYQFTTQAGRCKHVGCLTHVQQT